MHTSSGLITAPDTAPASAAEAMRVDQRAGTSSLVASPPEDPNDAEPNALSRLLLPPNCTTAREPDEHSRAPAPVPHRGIHG